MAFYLCGAPRRDLTVEAMRLVRGLVAARPLRRSIYARQIWSPKAKRGATIRARRGFILQGVLRMVSGMSAWTGDNLYMAVISAAALLRSHPDPAKTIRAILQPLARDLATLEETQNLKDRDAVGFRSGGDGRCCKRQPPEVQPDFVARRTADAGKFADAEGLG